VALTNIKFQVKKLNFLATRTPRPVKRQQRHRHRTCSTYNHIRRTTSYVRV